jgi:hypothetical protein
MPLSYQIDQNSSQFFLVVLKVIKSYTRIPSYVWIIEDIMTKDLSTLRADGVELISSLELGGHSGLAEP